MNEFRANPYFNLIVPTKATTTNNIVAKRNVVKIQKRKRCKKCPGREKFLNFKLFFLNLNKTFQYEQRYYINLLNLQIAKEQYAAQLYLSMSAWFYEKIWTELPIISEFNLKKN
jgi:hypothetical protein